MKKVFFPFVLLFTAGIIFTACDRDERVTGVTLNKDKLELTVGSSETLIATVQPANASNRAVTWASSDSNIASVNNGQVTAVSRGTATITATTADGDFTANARVRVFAREQIEDAGVIINDIRWATRNVDAPGTFADNPQDAGMFYQWNRRVGWSSTDPMINSNGGTIWDFSVPATEWKSANNPCPAGWRVPTQAELQSLNNAGSTWITNWNNTGINGRVFGTAPNQIFLPATGWRSSSYGALSRVGTDGFYWSSTQFGSIFAWHLWFHSGSVDVYWNWLTFGFSVRCVAD